MIQTMFCYIIANICPFSLLEMLVLAIVCLALYYCYIKLIKPHSYWKELGIPYVKPFPILGSLYQAIFRRISFTELSDVHYKTFPNDRYYGSYNFIEPFLVIRDLDLIKQVTVKDFDHFQDHIPIIKGNVDTLWEKNLFASRGQYWRNMRPTLSPAFTSSKMKAMYILMDEAAGQFTKYLREKEKSPGMLEMKDVFSRFTNDVIATCAFGIKCDSLADRENEFYVMGKDATDFSGLKSLKFIFGGTVPWLMKLFGITVFSAKVRVFFSDLVTNTMKIRERDHIIRPDMIHLLMEAMKGQLKHESAHKVIDTGFSTVEESELGKSAAKEQIIWTDEDMIAQALIFLFAGFDTTSALMLFVAYELALNPDIQQRLYEEILDTDKECDGKVTYDALSKMKYLDMVVSESLRKWPPSTNSERVVTKDYTIQPVLPHEKPVHLKKGEGIGFGYYSIHRDPKYFPNPEKFDPERFNDENKGNIQPGSMLAFGIGPRNCIGSRFAILENKTLLYHLLKDFEIVPNEKTPIPLVYSKLHFNIHPEGGMWLGFKNRAQE